MSPISVRMSWSENFWRGWEKYGSQRWSVSMADRSTCRCWSCRRSGSGWHPGWFDLEAKTFEQPRNRYNLDAHFDLCELLTNFGSTRFTGGLNLAANLLGKPGKMEIQGHMVQDMYEAGRLAEINDYCRCDVLDTYFVFLRTRVMLPRSRWRPSRPWSTRSDQWLQQRADQVAAYRRYLDHWGDWPNPWKPAEEVGKSICRQP